MAKAKKAKQAVEALHPLKLTLLLLLVYVCGLFTGTQVDKLYSPHSAPRVHTAKVWKRGVDSVTLNPDEFGWLSSAKESTVMVSTPRGHGTGVCIGYDGSYDIVLTAKHVLEDMPLDTEIALEWASGDTDFMRAGTIDMLSISYDLATVRSLDPEHLLKPIVKAGFSPAAGDIVIAMGYPDDVYPPFVTLGHVVAFDDGLIEHTASMWFGNSGGPLFNQQGQLVGINVMISGYNGHAASDRGLSVPVESIELFIANLKWC